MSGRRRYGRNALQSGPGPRGPRFLKHLPVSDQLRRECVWQRGYWVAVYHSVSDPAVLSRYAEAATPVLSSFGARFLARGMPAFVFEGGTHQRCVVIEFPSVEQAVAAYESEPYQHALQIMRGSVEREVRIVPGSE